jgi:hypothetical protein
MDDLMIPLWPPAWVEDHSVSDEQLVDTSAEGVRLMSASRSDDRLLISLSWPGGRRYLLIDPEGDAPPEALRAGEKSQDADLARVIEAMWSQALRLAKAAMDGELSAIYEDPKNEDPATPPKRRGWRRRE